MWAVTVATDGGEPSELDLNFIENQGITFLHSKEIVIGRDTIEACHSLTTKSNRDKPTVVKRFANKNTRWSGLNREEAEGNPSLFI